MIVKLKLTGNRRQMFQTNEYLMGPVNEMHPDILVVNVYTDDGKKKLAHARRPRPKHYEKYEYKPLPRQPEKAPVEMSAEAPAEQEPPAEKA